MKRNLHFVLTVLASGNVRNIYLENIYTKCVHLIFERAFGKNDKREQEKRFTIKSACIW